MLQSFAEVWNISKTEIKMSLIEIKMIIVIKNKTRNLVKYTTNEVANQMTKIAII